MTARRLRLLAATLVAATATAVAILPSAAADDNPLGTGVSWTTYGYDLQRTGYNPSETGIGTGNAGNLHVRWSMNLGDVMIAQPVEAAGVSVPLRGIKNVLYEGTEHGDFYALDAATGLVLWHKNLGSIQTGCGDMPDGVFGIGGAGVIDRQRNVVFVAGGDGAVHSLDLATGRETFGWPLAHVFT